MRNRFSLLSVFLRSHSKQGSFISNEQGSVGLLLIVIMFGVIMLTSSGLLYYGLDNLERGFSDWVGTKSVLSAESCAEEAVLRIKRDSSYAGEVLVIGDTSCVIQVTGTPCGSCEITARATTAGHTRGISSNIVKSGGSVVINTWSEVN